MALHHHLLRRNRRQRGQAIVWLLATLAASAAVMLAVYSTTQVTVNQQRTVNAADAAALAGANVEARLLNLVAYNNRAIVANEAFLIQMLSLESWTQYIQTTSSNISKIARFIPYVGQVISTVLQQMSNVARTVRQSLGQAVNGIIVGLELAKGAAELAHMTALSAGSAMAEDAANTVVQANRTTFGSRKDAGAAIDNSGPVRGLTFYKNITAWNQFTKRYDGNERTDTRTVLMASRDDFTTNRPGSWWTNFTVPLGLAGTEKIGGSQLKANNSSRDGFDRWETQDTLELWTRARFGKKDYVPIGWGRSNADRNGSRGNTLPPNRSAQTRARSNGSTHRGWTGVPRLYDIQDKRVSERDKLEIPFAIVVRRAQANAMTASNLGMGTAVTSRAGSPDATERLEGNSYHAMAKARVFFERPQRGLANDFTARTLWRADGAKEYGSLFSPYWQARLVDFSSGEKMALLAAMGLTPDYGLYTPGGQR